MGKEKATLIENAINDKIELKVYVSRYDDMSFEDHVTISLKKFFNVDDKTCEKIWLAIVMESLRCDDNNPWRGLINNIYKSRENFYSDNELRHVKEKMNVIYDELMKF